MENYITPVGWKITPTNKSNDYDNAIIVYGDWNPNDLTFRKYYVTNQSYLGDCDSKRITYDSSCMEKAIDIMAETVIRNVEDLFNTTTTSVYELELDGMASFIYRMIDESPATGMVVHMRKYINDAINRVNIRVNELIGQYIFDKKMDQHVNESSASDSSDIPQ